VGCQRTNTAISRVTMADGDRVLPTPAGSRWGDNRFSIPQAWRRFGPGTSHGSGVDSGRPKGVTTTTQSNRVEATKRPCSIGVGITTLIAAIETKRQTPTVAAASRQSRTPWDEATGIDLSHADSVPIRAGHIQCPVGELRAPTRK